MFNVCIRADRTQLILDSNQAPQDGCCFTNEVEDPYGDRTGTCNVELHQN